MSGDEELSDNLSESLKTTLKNLCIAIAFSVAFAYIEAAVVVYLRAIFHPGGFTFPMKVFGAGPLTKRLLLTEIGREAATIVLIFTAAWLFGRNRRQRVAYFLTIFAVWDIFYYVWLKVLIDWPASIMDWDILFLIPVAWASPVLYPVLISVTMFAFAVILLCRPCSAGPFKVTLLDWFGFFVSGLIVVFSFSVAGLHITEQDFASYFYRPLFAAGYLLGVAVFARCLLKSR
ncbi:MAG: hypothetical protein JSW66_02670 [Phycisphaerales bacterium]|nr:MAG: hypothetical protein JSW66_02670 [Phycisphaerales bacterium]